jgi:SAM-dependent methyltransferase
MTSSAARWGALWGDRPDEWAVTEEQQTPVYREALARVPMTEVLDVGCGTGVFLRLCADRGLRVTGLDASEGLLGRARVRVPEATFVRGDLQCLPFEDDAFDVVTGFTSFFFADDLVAALREAGRVARDRVVIQVFGDPAKCDLEAMKATVAEHREEGRYWRPDAIESLLPEAGLTLDQAFDLTWAYEYADADALVRAMLAAGGAGAIAPDEAELGRRLLRALAHCRQRDGRYLVSNEWHVVIARV